MSKLLAPVTIELSSRPHPDETAWLIFTRDGVEVSRFSLSGNTLAMARLILNQGSLIGLANIALSGNWGVDPLIAIGSGSTDARGTITITNGTGGASGSRSWQLTFKDGAWPNSPFAQVIRYNTGTAIDNIATTPTALTVTISGVGAEGAATTFGYAVLG